MTTKSQRASAAMSSGYSAPPSEIPTDGPAPKKLTRGVKIGRLIEKLEDIERRRATELANAPKSIDERFDRLRREALAKADPDVRETVEKLMGGSND